MQYVTYLRCSTKSQSDSHLGIDAQQSTIDSFIKKGDEVLKSFVEVESGRNNFRPKLQEALALCQSTEATLLIAKIDRLSRNASFVLSLRDSSIDFIACDMPDANRFTIGIFSLLAEQEATFISTRTKAALAELKKRGIKMGNPQNMTDEARAKGREVLKLKAKYNPHNIKAIAYVRSMVAQGLSLNQMVQKLNDANFLTSRGKSFHRTTVARIRESILKE